MLEYILSKIKQKIIEGDKDNQANNIMESLVAMMLYESKKEEVREKERTFINI